MSITSECGPHCGIRANAEGTVTREGHCDRECCHDGTAPVVLTRSDLLAVVPRKPMCDRWYERAGDYRPWHYHVPGCVCGVTAHALPRQHGTHCPVRQNWDRDHPLLLGEAEREADVIRDTGA